MCLHTGVWVGLPCQRQKYPQSGFQGVAVVHTEITLVLHRNDTNTCKNVGVLLRTFVIVGFIDFRK